MSSYLGRGLEQVDNISKLDNLSFNGGTTYALTKNSSAFTPISSNAILISVSGVIQQGNFSVDGTNIVFNSAVASSETCDFIMHYGTGVAFTPADNSITKDKTNFVSNSSSSGVVSKGDGGSVDGSISLNCSQNSHHTKISSSPHSAYSGNLNFVLPSSHGSSGQLMKTDGSGNLSFVDAPSGGLAFISSVSQSSNTAAVTMDNVFSATYDSYLLIFDATSNGNGDFIMHFRSSGGSPATITASNYKYAFSGIDGTDASDETAYGNNNSQFQVGHGLYNNTQLDYPAISGFFYFNSPFSSTHTKHWHGNFITLNSNGDHRAYAGGGALINQTSLGGVRFSFSSNDVNNLTARMYGLVNS